MAALSEPLGNRPPAGSGRPETAAFTACAWPTVAATRRGAMIRCVPPDANAPVDAIVFDLFDTLVDLHFERLPSVEVGGRRLPSTYGRLHAALPESCGIGFEEFADTLLALDREWADGAMREGVEMPTRERFARLARRLGLHADEDLPGTLTRVHMGGLRSVAEVPTAHPALLERLAARYRLGLCSNFSDAATALGLLEEAGLLRFFDAHAISETEGLRKPRPEIFHAVLGRLGVDPSRAVHVGDHLRDDVAGADAVGLRTIWVTRRVRDPEASRGEQPGVRPTWVATDLAQIPDLLP